MAKQCMASTRLVAVFVLSLALAGCVVTPSLPSGSYATTITRDDCLTRTDLSPTVRGVIPGKWQITLAEGGRYSVVKDGYLVAEEGHYTLEQDQLVFTGETGAYVCDGPGEENAAYKWAFDGKELSLTTVEDGCIGRNSVFTMHPLSKQD